MITLKDCWGDITTGLQELRLHTISAEIFVSQCQILLQTIRQAVASEKDDGLIIDIKESSRLAIDILRPWRDYADVDQLANDVKPILFRAYSQCLEFLLFRAIPVLLNDEIQQRIDIVASQIISIAVGSVLGFVSESDPNVIRSLSRTGLVLNFESLLSEAGSELGMLSDYAFGAHFVLENTRIVLTASVSELKIEGDRQSPRVYIPCPSALLQDSLLVLTSNDDCSDVTFSLVPIMFNVGINEKQEIQGWVLHTEELHTKLNSKYVACDILKST